MIFLYNTATHKEGNDLIQLSIWLSLKILREW